MGFAFERALIFFIQFKELHKISDHSTVLLDDKDFDAIAA